MPGFNRIGVTPRFILDPRDGSFVSPRDAAISSQRLKTSGLLTCTALAIISDHKGFLAHVNSQTEPLILTGLVNAFINRHGPAVAVYRFRGMGASATSRLITAEVLNTTKLSDLLLVDQEIYGDAIVQVGPNLFGGGFGVTISRS